MFFNGLCYRCLRILDGCSTVFAFVKSFGMVLSSVFFLMFFLEKKVWGWFLGWFLL